MTAIQKLICDEYEYFRAMMLVAGGMTRFLYGCLKTKIIENVIEREGVERQVYENRFGVFAHVPFPRYVTYDIYKEALENETQN